MSYFNKFFGIYAENNNKFMYLLGKKINLIKQDKNLGLKDVERLLNKTKNDILIGTKRLITTAILHQKTFSEFKNSNFGKSIVMIGGGPTVNNFSLIKDAKYLALNRAITYDKVHFDYFFTIDVIGIKNYYDEIANYSNCIKFVGDQNMGKDFQIPENYIPTIKGDVRRYKTTSWLYPCRFAYDIATEPLGNFCTVSLQAIQFILYTNPKKVYLAGIDCSSTSAGHFVGQTPDVSKRGENAKQNDNDAIIYWKKLKEFRDIYYPETEIISINPVGLKGVFKDIYTESYLSEHPEIREELGNNIEILNS